MKCQIRVLRTSIDGAVLLVFVGLFVPLHGATGQATCPPPDTTAAWAQANRMWSNERGLRWSDDSLRHVLLAMAERDQAARAEFGARVGDTVYARQLIRLDSSLAGELSIILDRFGLPTRDLVGPAGSDAAMLIVQHNWSLQERALALARALPPDQISAQRLAMLEDRVLVHQGKPQRWGSQFTADRDGIFRFQPLADTAALDARRAAVGMPPLRDYVCLLEELGMHVDRESLPPAFRP